MKDESTPSGAPEPPGMPNREGGPVATSAPFRFNRVGTNFTMASVWDTYETWLNDPDRDIRDRAIQGLGSIHQDPGNTNDNVLLALAHFSHHPDPRARTFVAGSLGKRKEGGIPLLSLLSSDKEPIVREWAAGNLGHFGAAALPALKPLLQDPMSRVCAAAVSSLCRASFWHRLILGRLLFHPDEVVRQWARAGFKMGSRTSIGFLESAAEVSDPAGLNARALLQRMGRGKSDLDYLFGEDPELEPKEGPTDPAPL